MQGSPDTQAFGLYPEVWGEKEGVRVITCSGEGVGKSTLIDRLFPESLREQIDQHPDPHLPDSDSGLEPQPGIARGESRHRDEAGKHSFIVIETPGHERHLNQVVACASTADVAILLVDASKGVESQARHLSMTFPITGIRHVILAVNKMDLAEWSRPVYDGIVEAYSRFADQLGLTGITCIPVSALTGDNVIEPSVPMDWHRGPTLLQALESIDIAIERARMPFRMPVQSVSHSKGGICGLAGTIVSGQVHAGDSVLVCPANEPSTVKRIIAPDGDTESARAGEAVTLVLADPINARRGDVIASAAHPPGHSNQFACHLVWMHEHVLVPERPYLLKIGTCEAGVQITDIKYRLSVDSLEHLAGKTLGLHDIASCNLSLNRQIAFDPGHEIPEMARFILIGRYTQVTMGAGMIDFGLRRASNLTRHTLAVDKPARAAQKNQEACVLWFTGLSGSGKSTAANAVEQRLHALGRHSYVLDGDNLRHGLTKDLGFTEAGRAENVRRIAEVARLFVDAGLIILVSVISPFRDERRMAREMMGDGEFIEVFVDAPLEVCERRDPKGLYKKARAGQIKNFTGIDSAYEPPEHPEIVLETAKRSVQEVADEVIDYLQSRVGIAGRKADRAS